MLSCCVIVWLMRLPRIVLINLHSTMFSTSNSPSLSLVSPSFESDVSSSGPTGVGGKYQDVAVETWLILDKDEEK